MKNILTCILMVVSISIFAQNNPAANPYVTGIITTSPMNVGDMNDVLWGLGNNGGDPIPAGGAVFNISFPPNLTIDQSTLDLNTAGADPAFFNPVWFSDAGTTYLQIQVVGDGMPAASFMGPQFAFDMSVKATASAVGPGVLTANATAEPAISGNTTSGDDNANSVVNVEAALPVSLTKFDARSDGEVVKLTWATVAELNNKGFEIERSLDGETFTQLGFVKGLGTTTARQQYEYVDRKPSVHNYYRLKQVDFDGKYEYSEIRFVKMDKLVSEITMYPNPFTDKLNITMPADIKKTIKVYNQSGELIRSVETEDNIFQITDLLDGLYLVRILDQAGTELMNKQVVKVQ